MNDFAQIHLNKPQFLLNAIKAHINIVLWGRGTGKTERALCDFMLNNIQQMPRGVGGLVGATYDQILTRTIPALVSGLSSYGLKKDLHYFIGKEPPKSFIKQGFKLPYKMPESPKHFIFFWNGAGLYLFSLDRPALANGASIDWLIGDEAKRFDNERLKNDVLLTIRGNAQYFGHLSGHQSIMLASDMPNTQKGAWLLDYAEKMDPEIIEAIFYLQMKLNAAIKKARQVGTNNALPIKRQIKKLEAALFDLRQNSVFVSFASTIENRHVLGANTFENYLETLDKRAFFEGVLNLILTGSKNGFYALFDEDLHGYTASNFTELDRGGPKNSSWDADINPAAPLDIALDFNASINSLVVGQKEGRTGKIINAFFVKSPGLIKDVLADFARYYAQHKNKQAVFYYDQTAIGANAATAYNFAQEVINTLNKLGWKVQKKYIGAAWQHETKYALWADVLGEKSFDLPKIRININNAGALVASMQNARAIPSGDGFKKDKSDEKKINYPQELAPHLSDAADTLLIGWAAKKQKNVSILVDNF